METSDELSKELESFFLNVSTVQKLRETLNSENIFQRESFSGSSPLHLLLRNESCTEKMIREVLRFDKRAASLKNNDDHLTNYYSHQEPMICPFMSCYENEKMIRVFLEEAREQCDVVGLFLLGVWRIKEKWKSGGLRLCDYYSQQSDGITTLNSLMENFTDLSKAIRVHQEKNSKSPDQNIMCRFFRILGNKVKKYRMIVKVLDKSLMRQLLCEGKMRCRRPVSRMIPPLSKFLRDARDHFQDDVILKEVLELFDSEPSLFYDYKCSVSGDGHLHFLFIFDRFYGDLETYDRQRSKIKLFKVIVDHARKCKISPLHPFFCGVDKNGKSALHVLLSDYAISENLEFLDLYLSFIGKEGLEKIEKNNPKNTPLQELIRSRQKWRISTVGHRSGESAQRNALTLINKILEFLSDEHAKEQLGEKELKHLLKIGYRDVIKFLQSKKFLRFLTQREIVWDESAIYQIQMSGPYNRIIEAKFDYGMVSSYTGFVDSGTYALNLLVEEIGEKYEIMMFGYCCESMRERNVYLGNRQGGFSVDFNGRIRNDGRESSGNPLSLKKNDIVTLGFDIRSSGNKRFRMWVNGNAVDGIDGRSISNVERFRKVHFAVGLFVGSRLKVIPIKWSVEDHEKFPKKFRNVIEILLWINGIDDESFGKIPKDVLIHVLFKYVNPYWF